MYAHFCAPVSYQLWPNSDIPRSRHGSLTFKLKHYSDNQPAIERMLADIIIIEWRKEYLGPPRHSAKATKTGRGGVSIQKRKASSFAEALTVNVALSHITPSKRLETKNQLIKQVLHSTLLRRQFHSTTQVNDLESEAEDGDEDGDLELEDDVDDSADLSKESNGKAVDDADGRADEAAEPAAEELTVK